MSFGLPTSGKASKRVLRELIKASAEEIFHRNSDRVAVIKKPKHWTALEGCLDSEKACRTLAYTGQVGINVVRTCQRPQTSGTQGRDLAEIDITDVFHTPTFQKRVVRR